MILMFIITSRRESYLQLFLRPVTISMLVAYILRWRISKLNDNTRELFACILVT